MKKSAEERFWSKVNKTETCWLWTGATNIGGYGVFWLNRRNLPAHHFPVLELKPKDKLALHKCDVPSCVNPDHIFFGTYADNFRDMLNKGRGNQMPGWRAMMKVRTVYRGEDHFKSKLSESDVLKIRSHPRRFGFMAKLSRYYKVSQESIRMIINRESWRHI